MKQQTVDIGRGRLLVYEAGAGASALLLHAFPLDASMWSRQLEAVPDGWRFIAPDLRGFGGSDRGVVPDAIGAVSLDDHVVDLRALLAMLGIQQTLVVGLSMGGYIAQVLVRRWPSMVRGLVLCDTRSEADSPETRENRTRMRAALAASGAPAVADAMVPRLLGRSSQRDRPDVVRSVRGLIERNPPGGIDDALVALMARPDMTPWLGGIACPTQVIVGEEDEITPVALHRKMQQEVRDAALAVIRGAGHLSNLEAPDAFNAVLHAFLERVGTS